MTFEEQAFGDIETAAQALAEALAETINTAIERRGRALIAVSGGSTPTKVFPILRGLDVDWAKVMITLTDERWVTSDHPDSNEKLVRDYLLQGEAEKASFTAFYGGETSSDEGRTACETRLDSLELPFDAVYLGTAVDGHFASLFPGTTALEERKGLCVALPETAERQARMSLTLPAILNARQIFLMFAGADKHAAYTKARAPGPYAELPLRLVLQQDETPVSVLTAP